MLTNETLSRVLWSRKEVATMLGLSTRTIDKCVAGGSLKAVRVGRKVMISASELTRFTKRDHPTIKPACMVTA